MSNRQTHVTIGTLAGCGVAAYRAREQEPLNMLLEVIGGSLGGYIGGRLPDVIEPASYPGHLQLAHSAATSTVIGIGSYKLLEKWEELCRSKTECYRRVRGLGVLSGFDEFLYLLAEIMLHIATGTLSGLGAGYFSLLVLDGGTPAGLPILM